MLRKASIIISLCACVLATLAMAAPIAAADTRDDHVEQRRHIKRRAIEGIGSPYSYGGTSPSGFDCSGFTTWVFDGHGADLPRSSADQFALGSHEGYDRIWKRKNLEIGDLVFHKTTSARVGHVGIYVGRGKFISATSSEGVQRRSIWDPYYWGSRWVGAVRVPSTQA